MTIFPASAETLYTPASRKLTSCLPSIHRVSASGVVSKDFTLATCSEPKVMTTDVNDYVKGEFYVKMNDADWNYEMVVDFFADADAAKLPAGTYTYSAENKPGTFGAKSCLNTYSQSGQTYPAAYVQLCPEIHMVTATAWWL